MPRPGSAIMALWDVVLRLNDPVGFRFSCECLLGGR